MRLARIKAHSGELLRLDLLRFIASVGIVWHHSHEFFYARVDRAAVHEETRALALFVDLFFVISGFVIAYVYDGRIAGWRDFGRFMQRRAGRLVPLHWLTLLISWAFWVAVTRFAANPNAAIDTSVECLARTTALSHAIVGCDGTAPNGVSWSISTEMMLYLLYPIFAVLLRRQLALTVTAAVALAVACSYAVRFDVTWDMVYAPLRGLPSFLLGMLLFAARKEVARLPVGSPALLAATAVLFVLMMSDVPQFAVLAMVYVVALMAIASDTRGPPGPAISRLAPLGQLTYSIYMWHLIIIIVVMNAIGDKFLNLSAIPMAALAVLCYAIIAAVSYLSWTLIETPARRWIDSW